MCLEVVVDHVLRFPGRARATHDDSRRSQPDRSHRDYLQVFSDVDTTVEEWTAAHADLAWANLTTPNCYFLDWEDWGTAPRGWDAASLWSESLAVPALADRVYQERRADWTVVRASSLGCIAARSLSTRQHRTPDLCWSPPGLPRPSYSPIFGREQARVARGQLWRHLGTDALCKQHLRQRCRIDARGTPLLDGHRPAPGCSSAG